MMSRQNNIFEQLQVPVTEQMYIVYMYIAFEKIRLLTKWFQPLSKMSEILLCFKTSNLY